MTHDEYVRMKESASLLNTLANEISDEIRECDDLQDEIYREEVKVASLEEGKETFKMKQDVIYWQIQKMYNELCALEYAVNNMKFENRN